MYPKFKTNLTGLGVALGFVAAGFGLGDVPRGPSALVAAYAEPAAAADGVTGLDETRAAEARAASGRTAVRRQLGMPYVSLAALMPRQES